MYLKMGLMSNGCKLCKDTDFTLLAENDRYGFDLKKQFCNTCGLIQTYPTLSNQFLNEFYAKLYRPLYKNAKKSVDYSKIIIRQEKKGANLIAYLEQHLTQPLGELHLVEIGCSAGGILAAVAPRFKSVQGCDLDIEGTAYARTKLGLNVETQAMPSKLPDGPIIFLMSHVLEHMNDPLQKLRSIRNLMKADDLFVILVPGINAVKQGKYKNNLRRYFHIGHLIDFSAGTLQSMGEQAGLHCLHADERVNSIFKNGEIKTTPPTRRPQDSLANILEIERTYRWF